MKTKKRSRSCLQWGSYEREYFASLQLDGRDGCHFDDRDRADDGYLGACRCGLHTNADTDIDADTDGDAQADLPATTAATDGDAFAERDAASHLDTNSVVLYRDARPAADRNSGLRGAHRRRYADESRRCRPRRSRANDRNHPQRRECSGDPCRDAGDDG